MPYHCYAPPSQVGGGGGFEGSLIPAACSLRGAFALYGGYLLHVHTDV